MRLADKDYYTALDDEEEGALQLIHGTVAGNIIQLDAAHVQILSIARTEDADRIMFEMTVGLNIDAGQDDLLITAK